MYLWLVLPVTISVLNVRAESLDDCDGDCSLQLLQRKADSSTTADYTLRMKGKDPIMLYDSSAPEFGKKPKLQAYCAIGSCDSDGLCKCLLGQGFYLGPMSELQNWLDVTSGRDTLSTFAVQRSGQDAAKHHQTCQGKYAFCYGVPCTCPKDDCFDMANEDKDGDCKCIQMEGNFSTINPLGCKAEGALVPGVPLGFRGSIQMIIPDVRCAGCGIFSTEKRKQMKLSGFGSSV
eukprot:s3144_g1.t1